jgi:hypothetical protein
MVNSILTTSLKRINNDFPDEWIKTINLMESLCLTKDIDLTIFNAIQGKGIYLENKNKKYAIEYIRKELNISKKENNYDEMNFAIIIHKKTKILANSGVPKSKVALCSVINNDVFYVSKEKLAILGPKLVRSINNDRSIFYNFEDMMKILNIEEKFIK